MTGEEEMDEVADGGEAGAGKGGMKAVRGSMRKSSWPPKGTAQEDEGQRRNR